MGGERIEEYDQAGPDGTIFTMRHNVETGSTEIVGRRPGPPPRGGSVRLPELDAIRLAVDLPPQSATEGWDRMERDWQRMERGAKR